MLVLEAAQRSLEQSAATINLTTHFGDKLQEVLQNSYQADSGSQSFLSAEAMVTTPQQI